MHTYDAFFIINSSFIHTIYLNLFIFHTYSELGRGWWDESLLTAHHDDVVHDVHWKGPWFLIPRLFLKKEKKERKNVEEAAKKREDKI